MCKTSTLFFSVFTAMFLLLHHHGVGGLRTDPGGYLRYLLAVLPEFGLSLYQQPSGNDMRASLAGRTAAEPMPRRIEDMSEA